MPRAPVVDVLTEPLPSALSQRRFSPSDGVEWREKHYSNRQGLCSAESASGARLDDPRAFSGLSKTEGASHKKNLSTSHRLRPPSVPKKGDGLQPLWSEDALSQP